MQNTSSNNLTPVLNLCERVKASYDVRSSFPAINPTRSDLLHSLQSAFNRFMSEASKPQGSATLREMRADAATITDHLAQLAFGLQAEK